MSVPRVKVKVLVNKTSNNIVLGDLGVTLAPDSQIDISKFDQKQLENSVSVRRFTELGWLEVAEREVFQQGVYTDTKGQRLPTPQDEFPAGDVGANVFLDTSETRRAKEELKEMQLKPISRVKVVEGESDGNKALGELSKNDAGPVVVKDTLQKSQTNETVKKRGRPRKNPS